MLEARDLHTYYGDSHILQGVSVEVRAGQCVALLGRNGAGKTTTLRSIVGLTPPRSGHVRFQGRDISRERTHLIIRSGIAFVPEDRGIFPSVTVDEHLRLAVGASKHRPRRRSPAYVYEVFPRLAARKQSLGGQLSGGEQQMLAIGRALVAGPDLLILDEPSEGLAPVIVEQLEDVLRTIRRDGTPILLVEQNYFLATRLADFVYVLSQGHVKFAGVPAELASSEDVRRTYLSV